MDFFNRKDLKNAIKSKKEIFRKLHSQQVTVIFLEDKTENVLALKDTEGCIWMIGNNIKD